MATTNQTFDWAKEVWDGGRSQTYIYTAREILLVSKKITAMESKNKTKVIYYKFHVPNFSIL